MLREGLEWLGKELSVAGKRSLFGNGVESLGNPWRCWKSGRVKVKVFSCLGDVKGLVKVIRCWGRR